MSTTTTTAAPIPVQVRILHDPANRLHGNLPAEVNAQGLVLDADTPVVIPTGSPVTYLGSNRLAVKVEDREVHLAIKRSLCNQNLLTYDLAAYLHGDIDQPEAKTYALPLMLFLPALLVLGIPVVMWFILGRAEQAEARRAVETALTADKAEDVRRQNINDVADGLSQFDWAFAAKGVVWLNDLDAAQKALDDMVAAGSMQGEPLKNAVQSLERADLNTAARSLKESPAWIKGLRTWVFLGSILLAVMLAGICLANAFHQGWRVGRRLAAATSVAVFGYLLAFGSLFVLEYDFTQRNENPKDIEDRNLSKRLVPQAAEGPARFSVNAPGTAQVDKVNWKVTPEETISLDRMTWSDAQIGMTYSVMYGKLPEKWTNYILDEARIEVEALQDQPPNTRITNMFVGELPLNRPKDSNPRATYPIREFKMELPNKENLFRRAMTVPREDGTWLYWTTATGRAADQLRWPIQFFHSSFRITDLPTKPNATAAAAVPGLFQPRRRVRGGGGPGAAGVGMPRKSPQGAAVRWPGVTQPAPTRPEGPGRSTAPAGGGAGGVPAPSGGGAIPRPTGTAPQ